MIRPACEHPLVSLLPEEVVDKVARMAFEPHPTAKLINLLHFEREQDVLLVRRYSRFVDYTTFKGKHLAWLGRRCLLFDYGDFELRESHREWVRQWDRNKYAKPVVRRLQQKLRRLHRARKYHTRNKRAAEAYYMNLKECHEALAMM